MKSTPLIQILLLLPALWLAGCASQNVNPTHARARTGYVDFRNESAGELIWQVARIEPGTQNFTILFSELQPPADGSLRLAFAPGRYELQVTFLNRVISRPAQFSVEVEDGQITPVEVALVPDGSALVQFKEKRIGTTVKGYAGRKTQTTANDTVQFRVTAMPGAPVPYQPK